MSNKDLLNKNGSAINGKKTVVVGATTNPGRYAYLAANMLKEYNHEVVPIGIKTGEVAGASILNIREKPKIEGVDTVTLIHRAKASA